MAAPTYFYEVSYLEVIQALMAGFIGIFLTRED